MIENKRFVSDRWQVYDDDRLLTVDETVDLLNNYSDENERLKQFREQNIQEYNKLKKVCNECKKENEQLKQQKDKWKQQCIHFKEMLDDMDIAYLCDEWIYEELKGDVE